MPPTPLSPASQTHIKGLCPAGAELGMLWAAELVAVPLHSRVVLCDAGITGSWAVPAWGGGSVPGFSQPLGAPRSAGGGHPGLCWIWELSFFPTVPGPVQESRNHIRAGLEHLEQRGAGRCRGWLGRGVVTAGGLSPSQPGRQQRCGLCATPASSSGDAKAAGMLRAAPGDGGGHPLPCLSTPSGDIARGPAPADGLPHAA